jgi:Ca-activated chloride channel family protein
VDLDLEHPSPSRARIRLAKRAEIPNRDFVLRYGVAGEEVQSGMLVHRSPASDGYVTFLLHPPRRVTPETAAPKEMIFVIDRSGSQRGLPLAKAKETMLWILDRMNPNDTFQVIDFGSTAETLFEGPRLASPEMKRRARAHIEGLRANGGTMMAEAVQRAVSVPADGNRLRIVTFMTDGYIGNDLAVIDLVRKLRGTSRWFAFGTGDSVNRFLLENMAREGGGEVEYVLLNSPGDQVAEKFYQRIASPVLTDLSLEFRGLDVYDVFPRAPSDVWAHKPLIVHARYRGSGKGRVIVRGYRQGEPYREVLEVALPSHADDGDALVSMWARAKVDELMRRDLSALQSGSFPAALEEEIVRVALRHRLLTQFTSFVAVEERVVNESGELRTVTVPVEMPQGVTYEGVFGEADAALSAPMSPTGVNGAARRLSKLAEPLQSLTLGSPSAAPTRTEDETAREEARLRRPAEISTTARKRLAPELIALLERGPGAAPLANVIRGKVAVKVELRDASEERLRALEAAGLQVRQLTDDTAIGWIEITALADLAEVDFVERVTLP